MSGTVVAVDWGSSAVRAWRFAPGGAVERRDDPEGGILRVEAGGFGAALRRIASDWLQPGTDVWLSGMVTSRNGWVETPYVPTPAPLRDLARHAVSRDGDHGGRLHFLPGVCQHAPTADVMRGEEVQVLGALDEAAAAGGLFVLPGTHSKWVRVAGGSVTGFRTYLTGELYALLRGHSIVGRLIPPATTIDEVAFERGVHDARQHRGGGLLHELFGVRAAALLGRLREHEIAGYLSGLLIGHELVAELQAAATPVPVLIGEPALVQRYQQALAWFGVTAVVEPSDAAARGLRRLATGAPR